MTDEEILDEFRAADASHEGHFLMSSDLRNSRYLQCARVRMVEDVITTGLSFREAIPLVKPMSHAAA